MTTLAITGHTSGLGEFLANYLSENYQVTGLSRKNGYHLIRKQDLAVQEILTHDVFINNAHKDFVQTELFNKVFSEWKTDNSKTIINLNCIQKFNKDTENKNLAFQYNQLDSVSRKAYLDHANTKCKVFTLTLGFLTKYDDGRDGPRLKYSDVAKVIDWVLQMPANTEITELTLLPRSIK